jgi:hypothetical protein
METTYTEHHEARFYARANGSMKARSSSCQIGKTLLGGVFEIAVPAETANELIAETMRRSK